MALDGIRYGPRYISPIPAKPQFNLEGLLAQPTVFATLQELKTQIGARSNSAFFTYVSLRDSSGQIQDVGDGVFNRWIRTGRLPMEMAGVIEQVITAETGVHTPFLTRFYEANKRYPSV